MNALKRRPTAVHIRHLARSAMRGALATSSAAGKGRAYASLVAVATAGRGEPLLLLSEIAEHTQDLKADPRASLLIDGTEGQVNPQTGPRVTLVGKIAPTDDPAHHARFLARHPGARLYAGFKDFSFYKLELERAHFVGGFARAMWLGAGKVLLPKRRAAALAKAEADVIAAMNADHADALRAYGNVLLARRGKHWSMIGLDAEGCDLKCGATIHRLAFTEPVGDAARLRAELARLATRAKK